MENTTLENILSFLFGKKALEKAAQTEKLPSPSPTQNTDYVQEQIKRTNNIPATKEAVSKLTYPMGNHGPNMVGQEDPNTIHGQDRQMEYDAYLNQKQDPTKMREKVRKEAMDKLKKVPYY